MGSGSPCSDLDQTPT
jgi:hypothetical protein